MVTTGEGDSPEDRRRPTVFQIDDQQSFIDEFNKEEVIVD